MAFFKRENATLELPNSVPMPMIQAHLFLRFSVRIRQAFVLLSATMLWLAAVPAQADNLDPESQFQEKLDGLLLQAYEGNRDAQFRVGLLYTNNQYKKPDFEQAVYWYKQAARQSHVLAQYNLGHQYLTGVGVERNEAAAMRWWLRAAEQDHALAQFNVGRAYYLGIGLGKDESKSRYWFERAAKNQEPKSIDILEQLGWAKPGQYQRPSKTPAELGIVKEEPSPAATKVAQAADVKPKPALSKPIANNKEATMALSPAADAVPVLAKPKSPTVIDASAPIAKPIAVYTNPAVRSVLITISDSPDQLEIVSQRKEWTVVKSQQGFPAWVHGDFIRVENSIGTLTGDEVNARSVPMVSNGTVIGRLNKGERLAVLEQRKGWVRVTAPLRFRAWVRTADLSAPKSVVAKKLRKQPAAEPRKTLSSGDVAGAKNKTSRFEPTHNNDDDWLFNQPANHYTLQLASFKQPDSVAKFMSDERFNNNPELHPFTAEIKGADMTYFLYGSFRDRETARVTGEQIGYDTAWIRSFKALQQQSCEAWKENNTKQIAHDRYCQQ